MKDKITNWKHINKNTFHSRLPGTVWYARLEVVSVLDKKTQRLLKVSIMKFWDKTILQGI